ncbi:MAG: DUF2961 domain-containing protein [Phenylobacterium sp.]|uniref:glycoside hydrolase family 172 protein n=1 Tax=Phenylobacterium sp. TaxID=1871053 RepID=UPI0025CD4CB5|nr:glycoside hydrolase family 172 protein [Phenylobacterium sp.]MBI1196956.1 DUF2961 domain-containing protein [Phenylobacterium sp.]
MPPSSEFPTGLGPLYELTTPLETRSISFENPTGARGGGGRAASPLGVGRKGAPARFVAPGETVDLADIEGPGTIRHIWMTTSLTPEAMRGLVIRAWWEDQEHPSVEAPLGDFFGFAHGYTPPYESEIHSVGERNGLNIWLPMPFRKRARLTLSNELGKPTPLFYQIDYTLGDRHAADVGRLHALFRRENPTTPGRDFEILPQRRGQPGRYLGCVIGVRPLSPDWWGEGEVKMFLDDDGDFPTIAGTGAEDYVGLSFCIQQTPFRLHGANWRERDDRIDTGRVSMYRWHTLDPVFWRRELKVTVQQIGLAATSRPPATFEAYADLFRERADDWSACSFWYEATPSAPLPPFPPLADRIADLPPGHAAQT